MDKHFLFDEIKCGFLIPTAVKQAWAAEIEVLKEIDRICTKHNIEYFADWGTFLGAIRHGGFVPWDDDLDIVMRREDLIRFLEVAPSEFTEGFHIQNFRNQPDYWLFMYKVVGRNHMCFEADHLRRFHNFPYMACVDIFVLDYAHTNAEDEEKRRTACKYIMGVADAIVEGRMTSEKDIRERLSRIEDIGEYRRGSLKYISDPVEMGRYLYGLMEERFMEVKREDATHLVQLFPQGLKNDRRHFPTCYFDDSIRVPFENITIPVPRFYDYILRKKYNEYYKFNKGGGAHDYPYFEGQKRNLLKILDFDYPEYRFTDVIRDSVLSRMNSGSKKNPENHKTLISQALAELEQLNSNMESLPQAQQLAVDMGNLIEYLYGEGTQAVEALEQYCEALYVLYEKIYGDGQADFGIESQDKATEALVTTFSDSFANLVYIIQTTILNKNIALFMPIGREDWSGFEALWNKYSSDSDWDVRIVPMPYYFKDYDGSALDICDDTKWWAKHYGSNVVSVESAGPEYLAMLNPNIIFVDDPYDAWNPNISILPDYYSDKLLEYTDSLIYVPRLVPDDFEGKDSREYHNMKYYVAMPVVVNADKTYVASEQMRKMYIEYLSEFAGGETRLIWEKKIEVSPVAASEHKKTDKKRILYGIGVGPLIEHDKEIRDKLARVLRYINECSNVIETSVCLYPPDNDYIKNNPDISELGIEVVDSCEVRADDYDGYYGDVIPVTAEFISSKKPVMIQDWTV